MLLQKEATDASVNIKAYQVGEIKLNVGTFNEAVFLVDGEKKEFSGAKQFQQLTFEDLKNHLITKPEILIIGTGENHQILSPTITKQINDMGIAVEAMASRQACHTYQVLTYEQRIIFALIYP